VGAVNLDGTWIGSLTEVAQDDGYWVKVSDAMMLSLTDAEPVNYDADGEVEYAIAYGNNLISYSFENSQGLEDALGDAAGYVYAIAGEGVAALNTDPELSGPNGWAGSLVAFEGGKGYWLVATADFSFSFNGVSDGLTRAAQSALRKVPEVYSYHQSDQQAFFFVESATIRGESLNDDDIVIAYNGDVIVGSRFWNGELTDIPAIGIDSEGGEMYAGYAETGDKISFKVLDASTDELIDMDVAGDIEWNAMGISVINLTDIILPTEVSLSAAYPNPFNPTTMLSYEVPSDMNVNLGVYDMRGRLVEELINDMRESGSYQVTWNADQYASGVYMIKLMAGSTIQVQKVMLVK
jgi:hypothetical protein